MNYYIHIPFCRTKCGYCAFYSESAVENDRRIDLFLSHLDETLAGKCNEVCQTLYVGGGTPTLPDVRQLEKFIGILKKHLRFAADGEFSIEANPETLDEDKIGVLRSFFNRISIGVQSFDPELRSRIGRRCSQAALEKALAVISRAEFPHWNCDLIYALPGQSAADWENDLRRTAETGADHVSCYSLTAEEEAALGFELNEDDERAEKFYHIAESVLGQYGIKRYEISNYAASGGKCRHNCNVWRGGLLRGVGPSAAGFDGVCRTIECASLERWLEGVPPEVDELDTADRLNEIFAVNLRTVDGWDPETWAAVPNADSWEKRLAAATDAAARLPGLLNVGEKRINLTGRGLLFWNLVAQEMI